MLEEIQRYEVIINYVKNIKKEFDTCGKQSLLGSSFQSTSKNVGKDRCNNKIKQPGIQDAGVKKDTCVIWKRDRTAGSANIKITMKLNRRRTITCVENEYWETVLEKPHDNSWEPQSE